MSLESPVLSAVPAVEVGSDGESTHHYLRYRVLDSDLGSWKREFPGVVKAVAAELGTEGQWFGSYGLVDLVGTVVIGGVTDVRVVVVFRRVVSNTCLWILSNVCFRKASIRFFLVESFEVKTDLEFAGRLVESFRYIIV